MGKKAEESKLVGELRLQDRRTIRARAERLSFLAQFNRPGTRALPQHAYEYIEDARICWLAGAYFATIVMAELAAEELLRRIFRTWASGELPERAGFARLIAESAEHGLVTADEGEKLNAPRQIRNEIAHVSYHRLKERKAYVAMASGPRALQESAQEALAALFTFILNRASSYWITPGPVHYRQPQPQ